eukprot:2264914-Amphidinium_carterae.1
MVAAGAQSIPGSNADAPAEIDADAEMVPGIIGIDADAETVPGVMRSWKQTSMMTFRTLPL